MKNLIFVFLILFVFENHAQNKFNFETDPKTGEQIIVGVCSRNVLQLLNWEEAYFEYEVDAFSADELIPLTENLKIIIIGAQWCSDSREVIPAFYKVLDYISFPEDDVEIRMVNRDKKGIAGEVDDLGIELVPTIIFYKNEMEAGRIIEMPFESIEIDMISILSQQFE